MERFIDGDYENRNLPAKQIYFSNCEAVRLHPNMKSNLQIKRFGRHGQFKSTMIAMKLHLRGRCCPKYLVGLL